MGATDSEIISPIIDKKEIYSSSLFKITYSLSIVLSQEKISYKEKEELKQKYSNLDEIKLVFMKEMDFIFDGSSNMKFNCTSGINFSLKDFADKYGLKLSGGVNLSGDGVKNVLSMKFQGDKSSISIRIEVGIDFCRVILTHDINIEQNDKKFREEYIIESSGHYAFIIGVNLIGYFKKNNIIHGKILSNSISNFAKNVVKNLKPKTPALIDFGVKVFFLIKITLKKAVEDFSKYEGTKYLPEIVGFLAISLALLNIEAIPFAAIAARTLI